jgi:hypothetical protein
MKLSFLEQRTVGRRLERGDVEPERGQPIRDELEVAGFVTGLARERELDVDLRRARRPRRGELAHADLVRERDLQQPFRIDRRRAVVGERELAGREDRRETLGLPRLELLDEGDRIHAAS